MSGCSPVAPPVGAGFAWSPFATNRSKLASAHVGYRSCSSSTGSAAPLPAIALLVSLPLGILAAVRENTALDRIVQLVALLGQAMPSLGRGLLLMILFGPELGWLPTSGTDSWESYIMPGVMLAFSTVRALTRLTRAGARESGRSAGC